MRIFFFLYLRWSTVFASEAKRKALQPKTQEKERKGVYGDYGRTYRKLRAVCQRYYDSNNHNYDYVGKKCLSVERVSYSPFFPTSKTDRLAVGRNVIH